MLIQESMIHAAALALVGISVLAQQPAGIHQPSPEHKCSGRLTADSLARL
jgi:hypothetical protein